MQIKRRAITAGATFLLAAATGHVMQNGETITNRLRGVESAVDQAKAEPLKQEIRDAVLTSASTDVNEPIALPDLPGSVVQSLAAIPLLPKRLHALDDGYVRPVTDADAAYSDFGIACASGDLSLVPQIDAMLEVALSAPCYPNERVTVSHGGLSFTVPTDATGSMRTMLPALDQRAEVTVRFSTGERLSAAATVSGLDAVSRIAVQWRGAGILNLHAYENGAQFGMDGHVWAGTPHGSESKEGGFLTVLGDPALDHPMLAQVYTAPSGTQPDDIVLEAEVSPATCGRVVSGQTLRKQPGKSAAIEDLSFAMPSCEATGDFLVMSLPAITGDNSPRLAEAK